nr:MAG TPA: hypothetical protein [Caudoviricetes sp.]
MITIVYLVNLRHTHYTINFSSMSNDFQPK